MFDAQILRAKSLTTTSVYSPWMPREGDNIIVATEVVLLTAAGSFTVELYHKAMEDAGNGSLLSGSLAKLVAGRFTKEWNGLKDLVRYKISYAAGEEFGGFTLFRMLPPIWFDAVAT